MGLILSLISIAIAIKFLFVAIKFTWGFWKIIFCVIFAPVLIIGMMMFGLMYVSLIILVIYGIISFFFW